MWFILTFRGPSRKSTLTILHGRVRMPRQESAPRKVRVSRYCALHEVSPASPRPAMRKRLAGVQRQRLALNKRLEAQPVWPRHERREWHLAGRGVEEAGDEGARPRGDRRLL